MDSPVHLSDLVAVFVFSDSKGPGFLVGDELVDQHLDCFDLGVSEELVTGGAETFD